MALFIYLWSVPKIVQINRRFFYKFEQASKPTILFGHPIARSKVAT